MQLLRRAALVLASVALVGAVGGCKKRPSYDTSTPDATLRSFARAVDHGDIPGDIGYLVSDDTEQDRWRLRCRELHCRKGTFQVVDRGPVGEYAAVLYVDYEVTGDAHVRVVGGKRTPVHFAREGKHWSIVQFGDEVDLPGTAPPAGDAGAGGDGPER